MARRPMYYGWTISCTIHLKRQVIVAVHLAVAVEVEQLRLVYPPLRLQTHRAPPRHLLPQVAQIRVRSWEVLSVGLQALR